MSSFTSADAGQLIRSITGGTGIRVTDTVAWRRRSLPPSLLAVSQTVFVPGDLNVTR